MRFFIQFFLACLLIFNGLACARTDAPPGMATISTQALPPEARTTLDLIARGGPYPYSRDGVVFQNREKLLPKRERGYYREYTVRTPGSKDRGARRIVAGTVGEYYYTDDHYRSFRKIRP